MQRRTRQRAYVTLMGTCVALILLAWNVVRLWSVDDTIDEGRDRPDDKRP